MLIRTARMEHIGGHEQRNSAPGRAQPPNPQFADRNRPADNARQGRNRISSGAADCPRRRNRAEPVQACVAQRTGSNAGAQSAARVDGLQPAALWSPS
jgi:hypothetical protein